jgi:non-specific serine/threonine protein kinase
MGVVHAVWAPDSWLHLWSEDGSGDGSGRQGPGGRPFAATRFALPTVDGELQAFEPIDNLSIRLPASNGRLLLADDVEPDDGEIGHLAFDVPTVALDPATALDTLLAVPDRLEPGVGSSIRFYARLTLLALELVARGRFIPEAIAGTASLRWRPAPGAGDAGRIDALTNAAPRICFAAYPPAAGPTTVATEFIAAIVDSIVSGSASAPPLNGLDDVSTREALGRWAAALHPPEGPFRTLFRLGEPDPVEAPSDQDASSGVEGEPLDAESQPVRPWRLEVLVGSRADPSLVLPAAMVWRDPGPLRGAQPEADPEVALLADLGRATRLYPPFEALLESPEPSAIELPTQTAHAFLREGAPVLVDAGFTVMLPAWWRRRRRRLGLKLRVRSPERAPARGGIEPGVGAAEIVDYDWRVAIGDQELTPKELAALASVKTGLVRVRGEWVEIAPEELASALRIVEGADAAQPRPLTVAELLRAAAGVDPAPGGLEVTRVIADGWLATLLDPANVSPPGPIAAPLGFGTQLRPYQERGVGWMAYLDRLGFGGVLADDMGLGKTVQLLALLVAEQLNVPPAERLGPTLLVCPMSLIGNWQREAARFAPSLRVHVHHGVSRFAREDLATAARNVDLVITTYGLLVRELAALRAITWSRVVLDEAQEIKNSGTAQSRAARSIGATSRFALTGTPIENRLAELWTIMEFANPGLLGSETAFRTNFGLPIERWNADDAADRLRRLTGPFILRRVKADPSIVPELPDKLEFAESCNLTREQATLYQAVVDELMPGIEGERDPSAYRGKVLAAILRLKQVCNHPALFLGDGSPLGGRSGKLQRLEEVLDNVVVGGERALVFTQFREWGERLAPYLRSRFGREVLYLHGGTHRKVRDRMVERFEAGSVPIFVLSLKAGGRGLNLVAANLVLHYDRWWNPAVEDQASDRAYRIGQTREVQVRTFVATGTLEEKIADMIEAKRDLASRIVLAGERAFTELSPAELRGVLALAAETVVEDEP